MIRKYQTINGFDHGLLNDDYGRAMLCDAVAKIPLVVLDPRKSGNGEGRVSEELVRSIDVPATISAYLGLVVPGRCSSISLASSPFRSNYFTPWVTLRNDKVWSRCPSIPLL